MESPRITVSLKAKKWLDKVAKKNKVSVKQVVDEVLKKVSK